MINPNEIIYWEILPAIRRELVVQLKNLGLKQNQIAKLMEITPSAISQYLKSKRADYIFEDVFILEIKKSAKKIVDSESSSFNEINILVKIFKNNKDLCKICRGKNEITGKCGVCFDK